MRETAGGVTWLNIADFIAKKAKTSVASAVKNLESAGAVTKWTATNLQRTVQTMWRTHENAH